MANKVTIPQLHQMKRDEQKIVGVVVPPSPVMQKSVAPSRAADARLTALLASGSFPLPLAVDAITTFSRIRPFDAWIGQLAVMTTLLIVTSVGSFRALLLLHVAT